MDYVYAVCCFTCAINNDPLHLKLFYLALSLTEMTNLPSPLKKRKERMKREKENEKSYH